MQRSRRPANAKFKWVKGDLIGKGSFAHVYLGLNAVTGELLAVKQVELPSNPRFQANIHENKILQALRSEKDTLKELVHPNIVQYLGYEESPRYFSIFLEYVPGGTISTFLQKYGRLREEVIKSFIGQILDGLDYLHSKDILHRDLKPDNILVEQSGICKISDFGISKKAEAIIGRTFTKMRGTVFWMAPEVLDSAGKGYDYKVDIWSLGCIALEMWSGEPPWNGQESLRVLLQVYQGMAPPLPPGIVLTDLADEFRQLCFKRDPHDRPMAFELRKHPYLLLPPGWKFDPDSITAPIIVNSGRPRQQSLYLQPHNSPFDIRRASDRSLPNLPSVIISPATEVPPPLVTILPLRRSKRSRTHTRASKSLPPTPDGASRPAAQNHRKLWIANPDVDPPPDENAFIYPPLSLPDAQPISVYSARLAVPGRYIDTPGFNLGRMPQQSLQSEPASLSDPNVREVQNLILDDSRSAYSSSELITHISQRDSRSSARTSDSGSGLWKKPPFDLISSTDSLYPMDYSSQHSEEVRQSLEYQQKLDTWAPRPSPKDVYNNLQDFFPGHDLEKTVSAQFSNLDLTAQEYSVQPRKSIRMVAEEQAQVRRRLRTKVWGSSIEGLQCNINTK